MIIQEAVCSKGKRKKKRGRDNVNSMSDGVVLVQIVERSGINKYNGQGQKQKHTFRKNRSTKWGAAACLCLCTVNA